MDPTGVSDGNNPKNLCRVEVNVNSYFSIHQDGKKVYNRGRTVTWFANIEEYGLIDLEKYIDPYFKWASNQKANFWVVQKGGNLQQKLNSNAQLLDLIRSSDLVKLFMIVGRREEADEMMPVVGKEVPMAANVMGKEMHLVGETREEEMVADLEGTFEEGMLANMEETREEEMLADMEETREEEMLADMDKVPEWREIPEYRQTNTGLTMAKEEETKHFMTIGCDPDGDEQAGAYEEWRYFNFVEPAKNVQPVKVQTRKRARHVPSFDAESVPDEEVGLGDDNVVPHSTYDKENPIIKEETHSDI